MIPPIQGNTMASMSAVWSVPSSAAAMGNSIIETCVKVGVYNSVYVGNSRPNQHEKWRYFPDFGETWGTYTLP